MYPGYGRHCLPFHVLDVGQSCRVTPRVGNIQQRPGTRIQNQSLKDSVSQEVGTCPPKTRTSNWPARHRSFLMGENEKGPTQGSLGCLQLITWWVRPEQTNTPRHRTCPGAGQASLCKPRLPLPTPRQGLVFKVQGSLSEN